MHWRVGRIIGLVAWIVTFGLGMFFAVHLAAIPDLETFKLLNIWGLGIDVIAVVILSQFAARSEAFKSIVVEKVSVAFFYFGIHFIIGTLVGSVLSAVAGLPSASTVGIFHVYFLLPAAMLMFLVEDVVATPVSTALRDKDFRLQFLGVLLLVVGLLMQFAGALIDLHGN